MSKDAILPLAHCSCNVKSCFAQIFLSELWERFTCLTVLVCWFSWKGRSQPNTVVFLLNVCFLYISKINVFEWKQTKHLWWKHFSSSLTTICEQERSERCHHSENSPLTILKNHRKVDCSQEYVHTRTSAHASLSHWFSEYTQNHCDPPVSF